MGVGTARALFAHMAAHRIQTCLLGSLSLAVLALAGGCSTSDTETTEEEVIGNRPHLMALSTYAASLGTPIEAFIANPPPSDAQSIELVFEGTFTHPDGTTDKVSVTQPGVRTDAGSIRWATFGPFQNPFTPDKPDIGVFTGTVGVKVMNNDGSITTDPKPLDITFTVKPSIVVTDLQPVGADCGKPALKLLGGFSYKLKATAIGFKAKTIEYAFQTPGIAPDAAGRPVFDTDANGKPQYNTIKLAHTMKGDFDAVEGSEALQLPVVPSDRPNYGVVFGIIARDGEGKSVATTFGMTAHSAIEIYDDNRFELAQLYPAKPVSSCIPGGQQGRQVEYDESNTETRQRQLSLTLSQNWLRSTENSWSTTDGKTVTRGTTVTEGISRTHSEANTISFEQTNSNGTTITSTYNNNVGGKVGGTIKVVEIGGSYNREWGGSTANMSSSSTSNGRSNTVTDSTTIDRSTATTDSTAVTHSETTGRSRSDSQGGSEAAQDAWTVSSSDTISRGFSASVIAGTYGVFYRQMARYTKKAFVLVYNKCGEGDVVGNVTLQDYVWAPDLALGASCPPLPQSNLPKPQCFLPPCDP